MRTIKYLLFGLVLCLSALSFAQSNRPAIESRLIGKPLYLRGMWRADNLKFDGTGQLLSPSATVPFTLAGIDVQKFEFRGDGLVIDGRRMGLELEQQDARARVPLQTDPLEPTSYEPIHIEIAAAPGADFSKALDAIFADGLASLVSSLPPYWQMYASRNFLAPGNEVPLHDKHEQKRLDKIVGKGKDTIVKPTLARPVTAPTKTEAARNLGYKAVVIVSLIVGPEGNPTKLQLLRPAGLGLDELSIETVRQYIFNPATQKGKPVPVDLNVAVDFTGN